MEMKWNKIKLKRLVTPKEGKDVQRLELSNTAGDRMTASTIENGPALSTKGEDAHSLWPAIQLPENKKKPTATHANMDDSHRHTAEYETINAIKFHLNNTEENLPTMLQCLRIH